MAMSALLELSAGVIVTALVLMLSWRTIRRLTGSDRARYGMVSRQWLMHHEAEDHR